MKFTVVDWTQELRNIAARQCSAKSF